MDARYTVISCLHITVTHALIVSIFLSYGSPFILHVLLLHVSSCIPVTWIFPVTDIDSPVTGYVSCWYATCGLPHLLFPISRYPFLCYQQSSGLVIMLHVPYTVLVLATMCTLNIIKITWGWGWLDDWLNLSGGCSGSIFIPLQGMVVLATDCI